MNARTTRGVLAAMFVFASAFAAAQGRGSHIKRSNPTTLSTPTGYTHVVEVTGAVKTIYIAGQIALDHDGKVVGEGNMNKRRVGSNSKR